jgi:threonine dehydratase
MMNEIDDALGDISPDLVVTPVGVGSLAQAVVQHCKSRGRATRVLAVEADAAACLWESLEAGTSVSLDTSRTIMSGMNCGTVSTEAWPLLRSGIDMSVAVSDQEAHQAVQDLKSHGVYCGPCGAATLTGLRAISLTELGLSEDSVVVLLSTEGSRSYDIPLAS